MDKVTGTEKGVIILKNDAPASELVLIKKKPKTLFGFHQGQVTTEGDIVSPLDVDWDAMRRSF